MQDLTVIYKIANKLRIPYLQSCQPVFPKLEQRHLSVPVCKSSFSDMIISICVIARDQGVRRQAPVQRMNQLPMESSGYITQTLLLTRSMQDTAVYQCPMQQCGQITVSPQREATWLITEGGLSSVRFLKNVFWSKLGSPILQNYTLFANNWKCNKF